MRQRGVAVTRTAYERGLDAGWLVGEYEGMTTTPSCPYDEGTDEHDEWWKGFGDGTDDYISHNESA